MYVQVSHPRIQGGGGEGAEDAVDSASIPVLAPTVESHDGLRSCIMSMAMYVCTSMRLLDEEGG